MKHQLFVSDEEKTSLRKATVFYLTVGSSRKDNATPTEYTDFPQIDKIRFPQIRSQLLPVLRRSEHFDFEKAKTEVKDFLSKLLVLTESEKEYVREFNAKKYIPNCCSRIKRWSIESNFIQWLCGRQGVVECFSVNFEKSCCFA